MGPPRKVAQLSRGNWSRPAQNTAGLPQGDPWSPIAMSALMAVASRFVLSQEPNARSLIYLDDRTLVATSRQALNQALQAWEVLFQNNFVSSQ